MPLRQLNQEVFLFLQFPDLLEIAISRTQNMTFGRCNSKIYFLKPKKSIPKMQHPICKVIVPELLVLVYKVEMEHTITDIVVPEVAFLEHILKIEKCVTEMQLSEAKFQFRNYNVRNLWKLRKFNFQVVSLDIRWKQMMLFCDQMKWTVLMCSREQR